MEHEIGPFVEPMLTPDGLDVVARERTPAEAAIQLAQQILLPPRIEPIDILRLQRGRVRDR